MYATTPLWIKGKVIRFDHVNPHTIITLEDRSDEDGQVRRWAVEGPSQAQLDRRSVDADVRGSAVAQGSTGESRTDRTGLYVPKVGEEIEFCAFPYKSPAELSRLFPDADFSRRRSPPAADGSTLQFVAGHVMVTPDGQKHMWEPHGAISECMRSSADQQRQSWLDFLNSNARARELWCEQRKYAFIQSSPSSREFVEEIDRLLDDPCR
jgi:hypothetical protein